MRLCEWYTDRELLLTGVTSDLGRALLEKILRRLHNVKVYVVVRPKNGKSKDSRIKTLLQSPRFERLREECPDASLRVKVLEGNLVYQKLGLSTADQSLLRKVSVVFHAAGPHESVFEFCQELPNLEVVAAASSIFKHRGQIAEVLQNECTPKRPLAMVRVGCLGPAYREPMPGFVEVLKGSTALMIGAGFGFGNSSLQAEVIPIDLVVNTLIAAARERAVQKEGEQEAAVYNAATLGCTWGDLIKSGGEANRKFAYPTFGIRGMTSIGLLHWILVLLFEWLPSIFCDTILTLGGGKRWMVEEYARVRNALRSLESISSRPWSAERNRVYLLQKRLSLDEQDDFPLVAEIDLESYILCAAASARKNCVAQQEHINVVKNFRRIFCLFIIGILLYAFFFRYTTTVKQQIQS